MRLCEASEPLVRIITSKVQCAKIALVARADIFDDRLEQLLFATEIAVKGHFRSTSDRDDLVEAQVVIPVRQKQVSGSMEKRIDTLLAFRRELTCIGQISNPVKMQLRVRFLLYNPRGSRSNHRER
jgi:hypothetical protein